MKTQAALTLLAFSGLMAVAISQDLGEVYCGRRLATALALLCDNNLIKRTPQQYTPALDTDLSWPWIGAHRAHSMGRNKRHVVEECCDKPCTINELLSYCAH